MLGRFFLLALLLAWNNLVYSSFSVDDLIVAHLPGNIQEEIFRILYGEKPKRVEIESEIRRLAEDANVELVVESMVHRAGEEQKRNKRIVRVGLVQNAIVRSPSEPVESQYEAMKDRMNQIIDLAAELKVNVLGLQEAWPMPFAFCTREKSPWLEFAESAEDGPSVQFIRDKAKEHGMVIISPILERDSNHQEIIWNTAVIIGDDGSILGKHRKNHIPRIGDFNEATYYLEGNTGHPVYETKFGRIAVNICFGRHHPLNWLGFALNGAEIVFNPSATVGNLSEPLWHIEARNAAIANTFFVAANNRVGTEVFPNEFTSGDGRPSHRAFGHFYGSSYVASPDGVRSSSLSRSKDGIIAVDINLNLIRQVKDRWMFQATARYPIYADLLKRFSRPDFKPQLVKQERKNDEDSFCPLPE